MAIIATKNWEVNVKLETTKIIFTNLLQLLYISKDRALFRNVII